MSKLEFLKTMSTEEFKKANNVDKLEILQNKSTGKCFFTFGQKQSGVVTNKYPAQPIKNAVISEVYSEDTDSIFFLLHDKAEEGVVKMETL